MTKKKAKKKVTTAIFYLSFQSLHAVDVSTYIQFLPTILNQLFKLVANTQSEDVSMNAVRFVSLLSRQLFKLVKMFP